MADESKRATKKLVAALRAERRLESRLADIDWEFDVLLPEVEKLEKQLTKGNTLKVTVKK